MSGYKRVSVLSCITEIDECSPDKRQEQTATFVSPISGIVRSLMNSALSPRNYSNRKNDVIDENVVVPDLDHHEQSSCSNNKRLFKDVFNIRDTSNGSVKPKPKVRRLIGMATRRLSSPEPVSPSIDKENNSPHGTSPQKIVGTKRSRHPLEDCDPNSQDSGYGASFVEKEEKSRRDRFRFAEPLAVAPRRMSIESRSPMESPVRSSPHRARIARCSLFRSISSGYESMDDGFNDLVDTENLDDATQLPNGITTLLCGNIVGAEIANTSTNPESSNPSTPEYPRTYRGTSGSIRRSLSLQYEKENQKISSLSKVRSCLFRSPNANSSTKTLDFDDGSPLATTIPVARRRRIAEITDENTDENTDADTFNLPFARASKRPEPLMNESPRLVKRSRRSNNFFEAVKDCSSGEAMMFEMPKCRSLQKSFSTSGIETAAVIETISTKMEIEMKMETDIEMDTETETGTETEVSSELEAHAHIKSAIHRSVTDTDLTGDFSKPCVLPLAVGHHEDLKSISVDTLAALIRGEFNDRINSFEIVDCRYPYEFDAGHIQGALNLYSKDLIEQSLLDPLKNTPEIEPDTSKRNILVFHCEFSWERGPNLSRFLRSLDRQRNKEYYPALHYPEVYLLHGGYEQFYREQKELCSPQGYRPMSHPDHQADLRQFRSKSKSWQGERLRFSGCATRSNLKRLGF